jgi:hypothetical protein
VDNQVISWLSGFSDSVFRICALLFVAVNGLAVGALMVKRDRSLVQRWTSPWLATNLLLLGAGAGVPLVTGALKLVVSVVAGTNTNQQSEPLARHGPPRTSSK